ncbi:MAG: DUF1311 domain-containing protein [Xanthobacteraceae bacterium]|nr:DUF1311 domain-containing protein [Xanthobacteraceae bacterium]QYK43835.1 MAG: DUF1311 domain-containing protein [Xanthobacteraceae bacterium]
MRLFAILVALFVSSGTADAQQKLRADDSRAIQDCLKEQLNSEDRCIGTLARKCAETADPRNFEQSQCWEREQLVWDDILNESYRRLQKQLDEKKRTALRDVQRTWIENRKQTCGYYRTLYEGGPLAIVVTAMCHNQETARRALYMLALIDIAP